MIAISSKKKQIFPIQLKGLPVSSVYVLK